MNKLIRCEFKAESRSPECPKYGNGHQIVISDRYSKTKIQSLEPAKTFDLFLIEQRFGIFPHAYEDKDGRVVFGLSFKKDIDADISNSMTNRELFVASERDDIEETEYRNAIRNLSGVECYSGKEILALNKESSQIYSHNYLAQTLGMHFYDRTILCMSLGEDSREWVVMESIPVYFIREIKRIEFGNGRATENETS